MEVNMANIKKYAIETKPGVYRFQNIVNGKFYIGSSKNIGRRFWQHQTRMKNKTHWNPSMKEDIEKHGKDAFIFGIVEFCESDKTFEREQYYVDLCKPTYNRRIDVDNPKSGWDDEAKRKMGEKLKIAWVERKARPGFKEKHGDARRGIKHSEETKKKYSEMRKGKPKSEEWKEKMRISYQNRMKKDGIS
jgi:group I intron endonuclease